MISEATLCSSAISTERGTRALTASITSALAGAAPLIVSVPETLTMRFRP